MKALIALAALVPVVGLFAVNQETTAEQADAKKEGRDALADPTAADPPPFQYYTSMSDFVGRKGLIGGQVVEVVSLLWGRTSEEFLTMAHIAFIDSSGVLHELDRVDKCATVFGELSDVKDFWLATGGRSEPYWVDEIRFATMADGVFNVARL